MAFAIASEGRFQAGLPPFSYTAPFELVATSVDCFCVFPLACLAQALKLALLSLIRSFFSLVDKQQVLPILKILLKLFHSLECSCAQILAPKGHPLKQVLLWPNQNPLLILNQHPDFLFFHILMVPNKKKKSHTRLKEGSNFY